MKDPKDDRKRCYSCLSAPRQSDGLSLDESSQLQLRRAFYIFIMYLVMVSMFVRLFLSFTVSLAIVVPSKAAERDQAGGPV